MSSLVAEIAKNILPYGLVRWRAHRKHMDHQRTVSAKVEAFTQRAQADSTARPHYSYCDAMRYLTAAGLSEFHVVEGSMPEESLRYCERILVRELAGMGRPLIGLHIGTFVGVSLTYLLAACTKINERSCIFSIDPDVKHRTIENPAKWVLGLLTYFGLGGNAVICTGYSLGRNLGDDGNRIGDEDPFERFSKEYACERQLEKFSILAKGRFDFCVTDGNHSGSYLRQETTLIYELLRQGGLLVLDDVNPSWQEVLEVYASLDRTRWAVVGDDGRIAVVKKISTAPQR